MKKRKKTRAARAKRPGVPHCYPVEFRLRMVRLHLEEGYSKRLLCEQFGVLPPGAGAEILGAERVLLPGGLGLAEGGFAGVGQRQDALGTAAELGQIGALAQQVVNGRSGHIRLFRQAGNGERLQSVFGNNFARTCNYVISAFVFIGDAGFKAACEALFFHAYCIREKSLDLQFLF